MSENTKIIRVPHTAILCAPRYRKCQKIMQSMARKHWTPVARREREGFFGFGAHTMLKFERNDSESLASQAHDGSSKAGNAIGGFIAGGLIRLFPGRPVGGIIGAIVGAAAGSDT
jgi:hypothetical protein